MLPSAQVVELGPCNRIPCYFIIIVRYPNFTCLMCFLIRNDLWRQCPDNSVRLWISHLNSWLFFFYFYHSSLSCMQGASNVNKYHVPCITVSDTEPLKILLVHPEYVGKGCRINIMFLSIKSLFFFPSWLQTKHWLLSWFYRLFHAEIMPICMDSHSLKLATDAVLGST